tara:strand:- start:1114 stop:1389 length:276 start_codon:yes stop_codon:yes gene_type:complete
MHSGMHEITICKRKRNACSYDKSYNDAQHDVQHDAQHDAKSARISDSPSISREDLLIPTRDTELELIKTRLLFLQKTINELISTVAAETKS